MLFSPVSEGYKMLQGPLVMTTVCSSNLHFNDTLTQSIVYSVITAISQLLVLVLDTDTKTRVAIKVMCVCVCVCALSGHHEQYEYDCRCQTAEAVYTNKHFLSPMLPVIA